MAKITLWVFFSVIASNVDIGHQAVNNMAVALLGQGRVREVGVLLFTR